MSELQSVKLTHTCFIQNSHQCLPFTCAVELHTPLSPAGGPGWPRLSASSPRCAVVGPSAFLPFLMWGQLIPALGLCTNLATCLQNSYHHLCIWSQPKTGSEAFSDHSRARNLTQPHHLVFILCIAPLSPAFSFCALFPSFPLQQPDPSSRLGTLSDAHHGTLGA